MAYTTAAKGPGRIPTTPGRFSGASSIPTPGRSRANSTTNDPPTSALEDSPSMSRALSEAIRANDPRQHRANAAPLIITNKRTGRDSLSPHSSPSSQTGNLPFQQSVRKPIPRPSNINPGARPPSAASSTASSRASMPKTPTSGARMAGFTYTPRASTSRPESRQSEAITHRGKDHPFEPGDAVRIGSLGMEGTLRFVGPIEGKPGVYAGVELAPGFAGRGKNDGTVNGVAYFSCAPKGGVFVALANLSAPIARPPSVASSRSGRTTPSFPQASGRLTPAASSGRVTPGFSTGRTTPSRGRVTPSSFATPNRPRASVAAAGTTPSAKPRKPSSVQVAESKITAGSRASRYLGMTAQQLQNSKNADSTASPTLTNAPPMSPFATPKPLGGAGRTSGTGLPTPGGIKGRQSATGFGFGPGTPRTAKKTDMPPPPSPVSPSKRLLASSPARKLATPSSPSRPLVTPTGSDVSITAEERADNEAVAGLEARNLELQERIANLMAGKPINGIVSPVPAEPTPAESMQETASSSRLTEIVALEAEKEKEKARAASALARVSELETQVRFHERAVKERESRLEAFERTLKGKEDEMETARAEAEARAKELSGKLEDSVTLVASLKSAVEEVRAGKKEEAEAIIGAKDKEIELLESKVSRALTDLEEERRELGSQIEELRQAGQETIALYEEKLNDADGKRWEMEDLVHELEEKLRNQKRSISPTTIARHASEAAQIDNETLREQVLHFERKVSSLETQLESARDLAEREEQAMRTRVSKYKENESTLKKDLADARVEVENRMRLEMAAKTRQEEVEEALRENSVALENARAEIESLRLDMVNIQAVEASSEGRKSEVEALKHMMSRQNDEVDQLKKLLEAAKSAQREANEASRFAKDEAENAKQRVASLQSTLETLESEKSELERNNQDRTVKLTIERKTVASLKQELDARSAELEQMRKNAHRDQPLSPTVRRESSLSSISRASRGDSGEEIAGLKHIIQELNKENLEITARIKLLESDKMMLTEECEELREAIRMLESNVDDELKQLDANGGSRDAPGDIQRALRESKAKHELELGQMRQKMLETEQKHAQTVRDLNKEVSELESLVEAKIYREDDLERELERYKDKLARASQRKHSKTSGESMVSISSHAPPLPASNESGHKLQPQEGEICEICEQPGHNFSSCPLLSDDFPSSGPVSHSANSANYTAPSELWCEDCESHGHVAADCPNSMDVF